MTIEDVALAAKEKFELDYKEKTGFPLHILSELRHVLDQANITSESNVRLKIISTIMETMKTIYFTTLHQLVVKNRGYSCMSDTIIF